DEQPLSGVLVRAPGPWSETASTDEEGRYRLEAGEGHLTFTLHGYRVATASGGDVVLERDLAVSGVLLDPEAAPLPNTFVRVTGSAVGPPGLRWVLTDERGRFRLDGLHPGPATLSAWSRDHASPATLSLTLPHDEEVRLAFEPAFTISGTVLGRGGEAEARVRVEAYRLEGWRGPGAREMAFTDARGRFTLRGLAAGTYRVAPYGTKVFEHLPAVPAGSTGVVIHAVQPVRLEGRIETPSGAARSGIRVYAYREDRDLEPAADRPWEAGRPRQTRTDEEGRFVLDRLVGSTFSVWVAHPELAGPTARGVPAGTRDLVLPLEEGGSVSGIVRGGTDVEIQLDAADGRGASRWVKVGEDGRFEVTGLAPDTRYRLRARSKDRTMEAVVDDVVAGRADLVVELRRRE
ncbi:MAG: carboxypeptidase regulatory-like domain-containing protein, partial [Planctomycetota bacterium]